MRLGGVLQARPSGSSKPLPLKATLCRCPGPMALASHGAPTELFRARASDGSPSLSDASESKAPPSVSAFKLTDVGTGSGIGTDGDDHWQAADSSVRRHFWSLPPSPGLPCQCDAASREADSSAMHHWQSSCPRTQAL
jgi:hypothetical protein